MFPIHLLEQIISIFFIFQQQIISHIDKSAT